MNDDDIVARINELADEEHKLERAHGGAAWSEEEAARLQKLEVALDQCWDLLRQRRARRNAGLDPDDADVRAWARSRATSSQDGRGLCLRRGAGAGSPWRPRR